MHRIYNNLVGSPWFYASILGVLVFLLKYPFDFFWASYDPYYHVIHSLSYFEGFKISYPEFTYFSKYPADPWFLYHILIGAIYFAGNHLFGISTTSAINIFQLVAGVLLAGALLTFFKTFYRFLYGKSKVINPLWYVATTLLFFSVFATFSFRAFFFERPHVLMILLVVLGSIAVIRKQNLLLFVTSFSAPLTYSFSFFCFLPIATIALGHMITQRTLKTTETIDRFIVSSFFGFGLGILAHPDSIGYIINGLAFHTFAIVQSVSWWMPAQVGKLAIPLEMLVMQDIPSLMYPFLMAGLFVAFDICRRIKLKESEGDEQYQQTVVVGFIVMSQLLLFASLFVSRTVEYAIPYGVVTFMVLQPYVWSYFGEQTRLALKDNQSKGAERVRKIKSLIDLLTRQKGSVQITIFMVILMTLNVGLIKHVHVKNLIGESPPNHQEAAEYLESNADAEKLILQSSFSTYPSLVYTAPELRYSTGMDARMTYFYSPRLSELNSAVFGVGECYKECSYTQHEALDILVDEFDIGYLLVKKDDLQEEKLESLSTYNGIHPIFTDSDDLVTIYEVITPE